MDLIFCFFLMRVLNVHISHLFLKIFYEKLKKWAEKNWLLSSNFFYKKFLEIVIDVCLKARISKLPKWSCHLNANIYAM